MKFSLCAAAAVLAMAFPVAAAMAAALEFSGQPPLKVSLMPAYGMNVPARQGLRSVVPEGWQILVHSSVSMPEYLSWAEGDPWTKVLADFAADNGFTAHIDWTARAVMLRSEDVAVEEASRRSQIEAAAVTPLPRFSEDKGIEVSPLAQVQYEMTRDTGENALQEELPPLSAPPEPAGPPMLVNPPVLVSELIPMEQDGRPAPLLTPTHIPAQASLLEAASTDPLVAAFGEEPKSSDDFTYTAPTAVNRASARAVAQGIASRFGYRLVWAAPEFKLQGPVTLLGDNPAQDVQLLQNAIGKLSKVRLELSEPEQVIRAVVRGSTVQRWLADAGRGSFVLHVSEFEPLEDVLVRFTHSHGYSLEWIVEGGFEANRDMSFTGDSVAGVLSEILPALGLSADIYTQDNHIVIRPGNPATDR